ncbi:unnamed protein product [Caenorhabditis angaria]|uniref:Uncharacterized protein n=1 Tax=Caenorhabditis angaria TaxID=860376 RepID=A0A9P1IXG0_9PELO|nr:unnamed protein product [Caenorhabditis angaria]
MVVDCDVMAEMGHSTNLRISLLLNLTIAIISIPIYIYAFLYLSSRQLFHKNTRIQIQVHIFGLIMHSCGR